MLCLLSIFMGGVYAYEENFKSLPRYIFMYSKPTSTYIRHAGFWTFPYRHQLLSSLLKCTFSRSPSMSECMRVVESTSSEWPLRSSFFFLLNCSEVQMKEWREGAWDFFLFKASALEDCSFLLAESACVCMCVYVRQMGYFASSTGRA